MKTRSKTVISFLMYLPLCLPNSRFLAAENCFEHPDRALSKEGLVSLGFDFMENRQRFVRRSLVQKDPVDRSGKQWNGAYGFDCKSFDEKGLKSHFSYFGLEPTVERSWSNLPIGKTA